MEKSIRNRTIALSALFQCVNCVIQLANKGTCDADLFESCANSVLEDDVNSAEALYGGLAQLKTGLKSMQYQLGNVETDNPAERTRQIDAIRYSINLLTLEKKLSRNSKVYKRLIDGITESQQQLDFFPATHNNMIARLAELYSNTVSTLKPRIMIQGDQNYLTNTEIAARMRTLLLAGIRAALLWKQAGGSRWKLLLERQKMKDEAERLLVRI